ASGTTSPPCCENIATIPHMTASEVGSLTKLTVDRLSSFKQPTTLGRYETHAIQRLAVRHRAHDRSAGRLVDSADPARGVLRGDAVRRLRAEAEGRPHRARRAAQAPRRRGHVREAPVRRAPSPIRVPADE